MMPVTDTNSDKDDGAANGRLDTTTVVICCYIEERWNDLCAAIRSVESQQPAVNEIIVVVDHNVSLRKRVAISFPDCLVIENTGARGLSGSRNSGITAATSSLVGFLDDDAVAEDNMFYLLAQCLEQEEVMGVVATIEPEWIGGSVIWLPDEFLWTVGCTYKGMPRGRVRNLLGAAMVVRRSVFLKAGGFNSGLGRNHLALPLGCEETEFCIRANRAYPRSHFRSVGEAKCRHKVPSQRATWRYLVQRCYAEGWSKAHVAFIARGSRALQSERIYITRTIPLAVLRGILVFLTKSDLIGLKRAAACLLGLVAAALGFARGRLSLAVDRERAHALRQLPTVSTAER